MIYLHIRTKQQYRLLLRSFSVERQRHSVVYVSLDTGAIFDRDAEKFDQNFTLLLEDVPIVPNMPHA